MGVKGRRVGLFESVSSLALMYSNSEVSEFSFNSVAAQMRLRFSHSRAISSSESGPKVSLLSLGVARLSVGVGEMFSISPVSMSAAAAGVVGVSDFSGWKKTGVSILSPVIASISESAGFVAQLGFSATIGF